jgi:hypothetical protein
MVSSAKRRRHFVRVAYLGLGVLLLVVAGIFGIQSGVSTIYVAERGLQSFPNATPGGAACGFAVAGGLCILASALVQRRQRRED